MKRLLIATVLMSFSVLLVGQNVDVRWSEEKKLRGYQRIIGEHDGAVFIERSLRDHYDDRNYESEIARYDKMGNVSHIVEVENLEKQDWQALTTVDTDEGIALIYLTTDPKDKKYYIISAQLYSHTDLSMLDVIDLKRIKHRRQENAKVQLYRHFDTFTDILFSYTEDKTRIGIFYQEQNLGKDKYTLIDYGVYDLTDKFRVLNEGTFETDERSNKYELADLNINTSGDVAILYKEYEETREYEFVGDKPGYRYSVYFYPSGAEGYVYDIKTTKRYIDNMRSALDDEGNMYVTGMTRKKPFNNVYGYRTVKIDSTGNAAYDIKEEFSEKNIEKIRFKKKKRLQEEFDILDVKVTGGKVYNIYQFSAERSRIVNDNFDNSIRPTRNDLNRNRYEYFEDKESIVIQALEAATGEETWLNTNPRNQIDYSDYQMFTTGNIFVDGDDLVLLYNDKESNIERIKANKFPKSISLPRNKTSLVMARFNSEGGVKYNLLTDKSFNFITRGGAMKKGNKIYLLKTRKNFYRFTLGKVKLN